MPGSRPPLAQLKLDDIEITLIRSRRRTLSLEVDARGIRVRAPHSMALPVIREFVVSKERWLRQQLAKRPKQYAEIALEEGAVLPYQGTELELRLCTGRGQVYRNGRILTVPLVKTHLPKEESLRRKLVAWYKQSAHNLLTQQVEKLMAVMEPGSPMPEVRTREYRRRWGSCDHRGGLSFNWRLIQAPEAVMRYVVVHELAHRIEFNHSRKFWQIVESQDPDWREHQRWLHDNGAQLYRF